jgi:tetratricopeptide (TPR) repeat protein
VYEKGTRTEFLNWYGDETRSWGRLRSITNPTVGNHEYQNGVAPGYLDYWDNVPYFYSFDVAGWHVISLDSTAAFRDSPVQFDWLAADIAASDAQCTIAFWHHPAWSIGTQGDTVQMHDEWALLVEAGVDVFLGGHDHNYQRFEALGPDGRLDSDGAVSFVVGTGGHGIRPFALGESEANPRVARAGDAFDAGGALFLELGADGADFRFVEPGGAVFDQGSIPCRVDDHASTDRDAVQSIADDIDAAISTLSGSDRDKAGQAVEELEKALSDNKYWNGDGGVGDEEGKGVFDQMKKAVDKLRDIDDPPAVVSGAIDDLVELAATIAEGRLAFAIEFDGDAAKIVDAQDRMDEALSKLDDGKPREAVDQYKKAWEDARDAGGYLPVGARGELDSIADALEAASGLSGQAGDKAQEAAKELNDVLLEDKRWADGGTLDHDDGQGVLDGMKRAVEKLQKVDDPPGVITTAMDDLVDMARSLAQDEIDEAVAADGDSGKIADAVEKMGEAVEKLGEGKVDDAVDRYKKAWEKARDALG